MHALLHSTFRRFLCDNIPGLTMLQQPEALILEVDHDRYPIVVHLLSLSSLKREAQEMLRKSSIWLRIASLQLK